MNNLSCFQRQWIKFDYNILLPVLARLPLPWGRRLATLRGFFYAIFKWEWRKFSFQDEGFDERTKVALGQILVKDNCFFVALAVIRRYQMYSIEEWEAACFIYGDDITRYPLVLEGFDSVMGSLKENSGIVFLSAHFGSCVLGSLMLQKFNMPIYGMVSNITDHPQIHPSIRCLFRRKYGALSRYLNGGEAMDREGNLREFVSLLKNGKAVVLFGDLPGSYSRSFLGGECGMASGPIKLAKLADVPIVAFVCEFRKGSYYLRFSTPDKDPYKFLEEAVFRNPSAWYAMDQLPLMNKDFN